MSAAAIAIVAIVVLVGVAVVVALGMSNNWWTPPPASTTTGPAPAPAPAPAAADKSRSVSNPPVVLSPGVSAPSRFVGAAPPPPTDAPPPRWDDVSKCKLARHDPTRGDVGIGFPLYSIRLKSTGTVKIKVIFVDFPDAVATQDPASVLAIISPDAEKFYDRQSYGKFRIVLDPALKWFRASKASTAYDLMTFAAHREYIQEMLTLAHNDGTVFTGMDSFIVLANPEAKSFKRGPAFTPEKKELGVHLAGADLVNGATSSTDLLYWKSRWLNHEMSHDLGLPDLYAFEGETHRFVGDFSIMGLINGFAPSFFAWEKLLLGWIDDSQVVCMASTPLGPATIKLSPIERSGGKKLVIITTGDTTAIVVESRRKEGDDDQLARSAPIVYAVDTSITSGKGVIKVYPFTDSVDKKNALLELGSTVSLQGGITVKFVATDADGDTVLVTRP